MGTQPPAMMRFQSVQIMRAVAVLMVMIHHIGNISNAPQVVRDAIPGALYFGYAGVDLFFVISGFIISHVTRRPNLEAGEFMAKRVVRILPMYWGITLLLAAVALLKPGMVPVRGEEFLRYLSESMALIPTPVRPLLGVGWTLQHEFIFYIIVAALMLVGRRSWLLPVLLTLTLGGLALYLVPPSDRIWDWKLLSLFNFQFALGVLLYRIHGRGANTLAGPLLIAGALIFIVTSAICASYLPTDREVPVVTRGIFGVVRAFGFGSGAFLIIWGALKLELGGLPARMHVGLMGQTGKALLLIGDASFVLYLIHNIAYEVVAIATGGVPVTIAFVPIAIATIVVVLLVGVAVHLIAEKPFVRWGEAAVVRRLHSRRNSPPAKEPSNVR